MAGAPVPAYRRILLVGFMGSGKSTVGPQLASRLGWRHVDLDQEIERRAGRPIPRIFHEDGEEVFRALEEDVGQEVLGLDRVVITPGGGWPCREGRMEGLDPATLTIWLQISPEAAVERTARQEVERPLLTGADPLARARDLLSGRERYYALARWQIDTESRSAADVVRIVTEQLTREPGRPP